MTTVRANCDTCGTVFVPAAVITVRLEEDESSGTYEFCCPSCFTLVVRPASIDTANLLLKNGSRHGPRNVPAEVDERPGGDPINHNDLIDFHEMIWDQERWREALDQLVETPNS